MRPLARPLAAEFLATFALVFIGGGGVVMDNVTGGGLGLVGVALAHALVLSVMVDGNHDHIGAGTRTQRSPSGSTWRRRST